LEGVYFGGGVVDTMEDGADCVGQFESMRGEKLGLVHCEVYQFLETFNVSLAFFVKQALN
jgi:hypothetical protein